MFPSLTVLAAAILLNAAPPTLADQPSRAPLVEPVKSRKSASSDGGKDFLGYLGDALMFRSGETHPVVAENLLASWLLSAFLSPLGGHLWIPRVLFPDMPSNKASQASLLLGIIGTIIPWLLLFNVFLHGLTTSWWWVPYVGWVGGTLVQLFILLVDLAMIAFVVAMTFYVIPRANHQAISDAFGAGGSGSSKRRPRRDEEDDE